ncbi:hypothetical protein L3X38_041004 [Prunus dulcis]|uniref:Uncharacterized protein n=1 Tax=Prunus dulcis TaxID=3755 RepID=A0AAD4UTK6_PRUDU|nr:hypothetical protein L3X38_041004 [Prunus dulcis]
MCLCFKIAIGTVLGRRLLLILTDFDLAAISSTLIRSSSSDEVEISVLVRLLCIKITTIIIKVSSILIGVASMFLVGSPFVLQFFKEMALLFSFISALLLTAALSFSTFLASFDLSFSPFR